MRPLLLECTRALPESVMTLKTLCAYAHISTVHVHINEVHLTHTSAPLLDIMTEEMEGETLAMMCSATEHDASVSMKEGQTFSDT